jgi:hypothetical protein
MIMTGSIFLRAGLRLGALPLALFLCQTLSATVNFTVAPAAVSNTYGGYLTFQVTGLNTGETVVVQKFIDANTNGVVDPGELLVQQFRLTDGQANVMSGVTNINVPGDSNPTNGSITARLNFANGDISQGFIAQYIYVLSSPSNHFASTNVLFSVTSASYAQSVGGVVLSGTNAVPYAGVLLFEPSPGGNQNPQVGVVADGSGKFTVKAPPGNYLLAAFQSNYVADLGASPSLTLGAGTNLTNVNVSLLQATQSISGSIVDASNTNKGLPGLLVPAEPSGNGNLLAIGFTDTNGNFNVPVTASQWKIKGDEHAIGLHGYLGLQNSGKIDTTTGSVAGVTIALPKATALFYGSVLDLGSPVAGLSLGANDDNSQYDSKTVTDQNGYYVAGALADTNVTWQVNVSTDNNTPFANYVYSQPPADQNGGTNLANSQALQVNFTVLPATNLITGWLRDTNGTGVANVQVSAYGTDTNGTSYSTFDGFTDTNGNYSLAVANGTWYVNVNCCNDCGNGGLPSMYQCPGQIQVNISNTNGVADFTVYPCGPLQIITNNLSSGVVSNYYDNFLGANGCNQPFDWQQTGGTLPPGLNLTQNGELFGFPGTNGTFCFMVQVTDNNSNSTNATLCITIAPAAAPLQITTTVLPNATQNQFYSTSLSVTGGIPPYVWSLSPSNNLPTGLGISTNGQISGIPTFSGTNCFDVQVFDNNSTLAFTNLCLVVAPASSQPQITTTFLPNATQNQFYSTSLSATGGVPPYVWNLSPSNNLPFGLILSTNGQISGSTSFSGTDCFDVQVMDHNSNVAVTNLCLVVNPSSSPLQITTSFLPNSTQGVFYSFPLGAIGGQPPYTWSLSPGSAPLPSSLSLSNCGVLSGYPTASGTYSFWVRAADMTPSRQDQLLSLTVIASTNNPHLLLTAPKWDGSSSFQFTLDTAMGVNYTVQVSTNLKNWAPVSTLDGSGGPFTFVDRTAVIGPRFYRVMITP